MVNKLAKEEGGVQLGYECTIISTMALGRVPSYVIPRSATCKCKKEATSDQQKPVFTYLPCENNSCCYRLYTKVGTSQQPCCLGCYCFCPSRARAVSILHSNAGLMLSIAESVSCRIFDVIVKTTLHLQVQCKFELNKRLKSTGLVVCFASGGECVKRSDR